MSFELILQETIDGIRDFPPGLKAAPEVSTIAGKISLLLKMTLTILI
jgi:hypothetical protein